ncbi:MAG: cytochrome c [Bacteroidetes bacterium]|nr:MAG: cytochrome c [Bacteroidota bacterium]
MKKVLKILGIILGVIILAGLVGFTVINSKGIPTYETNFPDIQVEVTPEAVERGRKLSILLCANCHKDPETGRLSGIHMLDSPPEFGKAYAQNITQDPEHGIGDWTDGELIYLLRTGVKRDGEYSPPWMAKLPNMADEDIHAIVAFLRSDDPMVAADPKPDQPCEPSFLAKMLCYVAFKPLPYPTETIAMPDTNNAVELGRYLAHNLDCASCHSADFKTVNLMEPEKSGGYFGGGNMLLTMEGEPIHTQNLTPDEETGIGSWTEEKFVQVLKYGVKEGEPALRYPMLPYANLTDAEAKAIYAYLQTVPAIKNEVPRTFHDGE